MNNLRKFCIAVVATVLLPMTAQAGVYEFGYEFSDGAVVYGTGEGTDNGQVVEGLTNIEVWIDGVALVGPLFNSSCAPGNGDCQNWSTVDGVLGFDASDNNFLFIDTDYPDDSNYTNYFLWVADQNGTYQVTQAWDGGNASYTDSFDTNNPTSCGNNCLNEGSWYVRGVSVPAPAGLALLGLGLLGIGVRRRR